MNRSFFNKILHYGDLPVIFIIFLFFLGLGFLAKFSTAMAVINREVPPESIYQNAVTQVTISRLPSSGPSLCGNYFLPLKLKEDNRNVSIWAFSLFQTSSGEMVAVRKINGKFHGLFTCGDDSYGNLTQKTVREARLLDRTGARNYKFLAGSIQNQRFKQIFSEAYSHF